jgi:hypothetical protein
MRPMRLFRRLPSGACLLLQPAAPRAVPDFKGLDFKGLDFKGLDFKGLMGLSTQTSQS